MVYMPVVLTERENENGSANQNDVPKMTLQCCMETAVVKMTSQCRMETAVVFCTNPLILRGVLNMSLCFTEFHPECAQISSNCM